MSDIARFRARLAEYLRARPYPFLGLMAILLIGRFILHPTLGALLGGAVAYSGLAWWWSRKRSRNSCDAGSAPRF